MMMTGIKNLLLSSLFVFMASSWGWSASSGLIEFQDKKELMDLVKEDNASSDIVLDAVWGKWDPFDSEVIKALPDFVPEKKTKIEADKYLLSGILWSGPRPSAIINDKVVGVGTLIQGVTVTDIREGSVTLSLGEERLVLLPGAKAPKEENPEALVPSLVAPAATDPQAPVVKK